jgi:hypothetical protein
MSVLRFVALLKMSPVERRNMDEFMADESKPQRISSYRHGCHMKKKRKVQ